MAKAFIRSIGAYVPSRALSNAELAKSIDTSDEWIYSHTGIHNRHIADDNEASSDLAFRAARAAMEESDVDPEEIGLVIVATSTPDHVGFPSTASIVQHRLGATHAGAMDIFAACTGFIYGLETARNFVESGSVRHALVIGSEVMSRILDWTDRNTCVLFGDGAGAALVSDNDGQGASRIESSMLRSEGGGAAYLSVQGIGSRQPVGINNVKHPYIYMDGRKVYNFAVRVLCKTVSYLLECGSIAIDDIAYIVPHQANVRIIEAAGKRMGIPREKFYTNMQEYANTSAASIPLALREMAEKDLLKRGDVILTIGFGGGLTYGGNLIRW